MSEADKNIQEQQKKRYSVILLASTFIECGKLTARTMRILLFSTIFIYSAYASELKPTNTAKHSNRPNIVLIVSDDHGLDALGAYGNQVIQTPNLDALARDGVRFTNAYATTSSCSPSRSVLLTGQHNHANGMYGLVHWENHFSSFDNITSLPMALNRGGYRTARVGKYHLAPKNVYKFDVEFSEGKANDMSSMGRSPYEMAELSANFIKANRPFFLYFATDDPHRAFPFNTFPKPNKFGNRPQGYPGIKKVAYDPSEVIVPPYLSDTRATREELAEYYQSVSRMDQGIGRLVEILKQSGKYDNTLIVYLSDNGIAFQGAKTTLYDPGIHLPLIVKMPFSTNRSIVNDAMISWVDITPTILDFAGIPFSEISGLHGKSFKSTIAKNNGLWNEIYASHTFHEVVMYYPMRVVQNQNYKLIWNIAYPLQFPSTWDLHESTSWQDVIKSGDETYGQRKLSAFYKRPEFELYNMKTDPGELVNLAKSSDHREILEHLIERLKNFQKTTNDPWYRKWAYK